MSNKILLCDDDEVMMEIMKLILVEKGYDVQNINNTEGLVEKVEEIDPGMILMDLQLPETGGEAAIQALKNNSKTANIPIVIFSAFDDLETKVKETGANGFFPKPFEISALEDMVKQYIL